MNKNVGPSQVFSHFEGCVTAPIKLIQAVGMFLTGLTMNKRGIVALWLVIFLSTCACLSALAVNAYNQTTASVQEGLLGLITPMVPIPSAESTQPTATETAVTSVCASYPRPETYALLYEVLSQEPGDVWLSGDTATIGRVPRVRIEMYKNGYTGAPDEIIIYVSGEPSLYEDDPNRMIKCWEYKFLYSDNHWIMIQ